MLCLLLVERRKKEREKKKVPSWTCLTGCAGWDFSQLLGAIKVRFKGQSLHFICT
jgi:hypothetical protein